MGSYHVDRVRRAYEAFAAGDVGAILDFFDPDVEWRMADDEPGSRELRGHQVVAVTRIRGRGKGSGVEADMPESHVISMRGDKAVRVEEYRTREQAVEAAAGARAP